MCVFFIFIFPSVKSITTETFVILFSKKVAFTHEADSDTVTLHELRAPMSKRIFSWVMIVLPEICILGVVSFTGIAYVMTSEGIANIIINSVSVCFVMDIDNMAREALQSDTVSEHVDMMIFETNMPAPDETMNTGITTAAFSFPPPLVHTTHSLARVQVTRSTKM
jgi:hypothetical protein